MTTYTSYATKLKKEGQGSIRIKRQAAHYAIATLTLGERRMRHD
jgi:hypothetical protein